MKTVLSLAFMGSHPRGVRVGLGVAQGAGRAQERHLTHPRRSRRTFWRRRCELSSGGRAKWVPGEESIHDRETARSEGKGGTLEEQNEKQPVRGRVGDRDWP